MKPFHAFATLRRFCLEIDRLLCGRRSGERSELGAAQVGRGTSACSAAVFRRTRRREVKGHDTLHRVVIFLTRPLIFVFVEIYLTVETVSLWLGGQ